MTGTVAQHISTLVRLQPHASVQPPSADNRLEPGFLHNAEGGLRLDTHGLEDRAKSWLAHAITRHPGALRLHVQRILLHVQTRDPAVLGALCDLYLVLGEMGAPLRRRMLALARPLLSAIDYQKFHHHLQQGACAPGPLSTLCAGAVLGAGLTGTTRLIVKQAAPGEADEDPLDIARQQLEYGQTAQAQTTLEQALMDDAERLDLHLSLLEIYRHSRDRERVAHTLKALRGRHNPAATEWQRLLKQLEEETGTE